MKNMNRFNALAAALAASFLMTASPGFAQVSGTSQFVTWDCTGDYCPWGPQDSGNALVWPASSGAQSTRHGYATSQPVYLPHGLANGAVIEITAGSATLYAGPPIGGSHRALTTIYAGGSFTVSDLASGEVLSAQNVSEPFSYQITLPETPPPDPPLPGTPSVSVTWSCTGVPCPWGNSVVGNAIEWPAVPERRNTRFGYTTSKGAYLGADRANGTVIHIFSGDVGIYAGAPSDSSHRLLANVSAGGTFEVTGLEFDEVLSVQSGYDFRYEMTLGTPPPPSVGTISEQVTWTCTGTPCPWGETASGYALVWPAEGNAGSTRLGYTSSHGIYLPRNIIDGTTVQVTSGTATVYMGTPSAAAQHVVVTLTAGDSYTFTTPAEGEVLSVMGEAAFRFAVTLGVPVPEEEIPLPADTIESTWANLALQPARLRGRRLVLLCDRLAGMGRVFEQLACR